MSYFKLEKSYTYKLQSLPRGRKYSGTIKNSCNAPFTSVSIDSNGNCLLCVCDGWLPIPVGQVQDFDSFEELFDSPIAKILQKDVEEKKFTWCAVDHCGIKNQNIVGDHLFLSINIDESCNLWCPSCRREKIMHTKGPEFEKKQADLKRIIQWLDHYDDKITIDLSGNGDPLASGIIRPLFHNFKPKPNQNFTLKTNGLLIKKQFVDNPIFSNIKGFSISVDSGSEEVYTKVRRGGSWSVLMENFDFLEKSNKQNYVTLNFAIQNQNYQDISNFVQLCKKYDFRALLHQLDDWGTWNSSNTSSPDQWTIINGTFQEHNVLDHNHPNFLECRKIIESIRNEKKVLVSSRVIQLLNLV